MFFARGVTREEEPKGQRFAPGDFSLRVGPACGQPSCRAVEPAAPCTAMRGERLWAEVERSSKKTM